MKLILAIALVLCGALFGNLTFASQPVASACNVATGDDSFFGLRRWYAGVAEADGTMCRPVAGGGTLQAGEMEMGVFVWTIVLNAIDILLTIIAYATVFFILYGGFTVVFSAGDPAKLSKGKMTIANALIGMVVALLGAGIVRFINDTLVTGIAVGTDRAWSNAMSSLIWIAAFGAIVMVVWGGIKLSMSAGDPQATAKAKNTIIFALAGAIIMFLTGVIIRTVFTVVTGDEM
jgi:hypothetical protein